MRGHSAAACMPLAFFSTSDLFEVRSPVGHAGFVQLQNACQGAVLKQSSHARAQEVEKAAVPLSQPVLQPVAVDLATVHAAARSVLQSMDEVLVAPASVPQPSPAAAATAAPAEPTAAVGVDRIADAKPSQAPSTNGPAILPDVPRTQPPADPAGEAAALVTCCQSGRRFHLGCLSQEQQQLVRGLVRPWVHQ